MSEPALITLAEVAERLQVSPRTARRRINEAGLAAPRPGRAIMLTETDFATLVEALRTRPTTRPAPADPARAASRRYTRRLARRARGAPVVGIDLDRRR